jgi:sialate O-acetylesterase
MVLQRDRPNTFWGWTTPGAEVTVSVDGHTGHGTANALGKWMARVSPPKFGGPYKVTIDGPQHAELNDVLVGDVWICSGQSNMEFGIGNGINAPEEIAAANYPNIRLAMVPHDIEFAPKAVNAFSWAPCTPESVAANGWNGFSAVAYFFGRELNKRLNVPIGLVETCWGGTIAEAWTSKAGLLPLKDFDAAIASVDKIGTAAPSSYDKQIDAWYLQNDPGSKTASGFAAADFDDSGWASTPGVSSNYDTINLSKFDGVVWYRKEITVPETLPDGPVVLSIGSVDDQDTTWVNGVQVGRMFHYNDVRMYTLPANVLKPGKNVIVVRCLDTGGQGGFIGTPDSMFLKFGDGTKQALEGTWKYLVGADLTISSPVPQQVDSGNPNIPTVLYNGMIYPIQPLAMKGAIWYQGESNAGRADQYRKLLPAMIEDWRREWHEGDFPFLIVQLANFMAADTQPVDSEWAELREAQTLTADNVRNGGLALAIDIGNPTDIHPKDKQDVGLRLALAALHTAYHERVPYSGPTYKSLQIQGSTIRLSFNHVEGGLKLKGDDLKGFAIAGSDHKFHWATAKIDGSTIVVQSADVPSPVAVRYDWGNNPDGTLYNSADLPTVPFKTDDWPWITAGRK